MRYPRLPQDTIDKLDEIRTIASELCNDVQDLYREPFAMKILPIFAHATDIQNLAFDICHLHGATKIPPGAAEQLERCYPLISEIHAYITQGDVGKAVATKMLVEVEARISAALMGNSETVQERDERLQEETEADA